MFCELTKWTTVEEAANYCAKFIDAACDAKRNSYIPASQQNEHRQTYDEASRYIDNAYPFASIADYGLIHAVAKSYYGTSTPTATDVQTIADGLKTLGDDIYNVKFAAIREIREMIANLYFQAAPANCLNLTSYILWRLTQPPLD